MRSTGPRTKAGKARSSKNAVKHGILSREVLVRAGRGIEAPEEFDELLEGLVGQWDPATVLEEQLVQQLAGQLWRLRRVYRAETGAIQMQTDTAALDWVDHGRARQAEAKALISETAMQEHMPLRKRKQLRDITVDDQLGLRGDWTPTTELEREVRTSRWFSETLKDWDGLQAATPEVAYAIAVGAGRAGVEVEPLLGKRDGQKWDYEDVEKAGPQVALNILAEYCKVTESQPEEGLEEIRADFEERLEDAVAHLQAREVAEQSVRMSAAVPTEPASQTLLRYEAHIEKQIERTVNLLILMRSQRRAD